MAYGDIGAVIETLEFDQVGGQQCWGIHVAGDVYAVAYLGENYYLKVATFSINAAGAISDSVLAVKTLSGIWGVLPHIIKIAANVFAIAYQGANFHLTIQTISISDDGLTIATIETLIIVAADCRGPQIIHVADNYYAVSYSHTAITTIKVSTITISAVGAIGGIGDTITLTAAGGYYTNILAVGGSIFAALYIDTVNGVTVATVEISDTGGMGDNPEDTQIIDAQTNCSRIEMTEALAGVFAIAHSGTDIDGFVSTVTIDALGAISGVVDSLEIHTADATQFHIIHIGQGICAITFKKDIALDGCVATVSIDAAGDNITVIDPGFDFETTSYIDGMLLQVDGDIYAVFYGGVGADGFVISLDISTPPPGPAEIVHHEMLMGMGP